MKKYIILSLIFLLWAIPVLAGENTHSIDLESGSSQYLKSDTTTNFPAGNESRSMEAWVKLESSPGGGWFAIHTYGTRTNYQDWTWNLGELGGSSVQKQVVGILGETSAMSDTSVGTGTWHHLAHTWDGTTLRFYFDGQPDGTYTFSNTVNTVSSVGAIIGVMSEGSYDFDGLIDEVRIWDGVRTAQEIADSYDTELNGDEAGLVSYWKLNNGLLDETTNNNDLDNYNSATFSVDVPFAGAADDTCTPPADTVWQMDLQDHCTTTASVYSDYGMECYNPTGGSWVIANGVEVRVGSSTNCIPQVEATGVFSIQPNQ